ncbi:helix-turn-helix domain-containing protein [Nostoc sp. CHAB 5834]|nr:helix-turn-helix domain-containing protein [Nostoc sp. CHAB 5834]
MSLSEKQIQCIALLATGMAQKDVAEALDTTPRTIQRWQREQDFMQALQASEAGQVASQQTAKVATEIVSNVWQGRDQLRQKELSLLEALQDKLMNCLQGDSPDFRAIDRLIKVSERRSKLLGLDIRNYSILDAIQLLLQEKVASQRHAEIVATNILNMEQELKNITTPSISPSK